MIPSARVVGWIVAVILIGSGLVGVHNSLTEWSEDVGRLQQSVTAAVGFYGVTGVLAGLSVLARKRWSVPLAGAWAAGIVYAASVSVVAFGGPDTPWVGAVTAGLSTGLICSAVAYGVHRATRS